MKVACVQVNATTDLDHNIKAASRFVREAKDFGADLVAMPENVAMMQWGRANILAHAFPQGQHPALAAFRHLAAELSLWLHTGTLQIAIGDGMVANRAFVVNPAGEIVAAYDKIHMFDVELAGGENYRESATFQPGDRAVVAHTPWGGLGLTICYDLRFPHLFRALAKAGAKLITVPAAFTRQTGMAHWHVLLRARAIETGCYVLAPGQCGTHANNRQTYGHSLIISPWGEVLAEAGETPGLILAEIDPAKVDEARRMIPALSHDRPFALPG